MKQRMSTMSMRGIQIWVLFMVSCIEGSYDEYLTCDKLNEARNARVLDYIPCDMSKQSYCEYKGFSYPDHAIQKFRDDNRALMRRLYGDVDSNEVYREMRSNNLFAYEDPATRYSKKPHHSSQRNTRDHSSSSDSYTVNMVPPFNENMFNGLHYNIRVGSGLEMVQNAKIKELKEGAANTNKAPIMRSRTRGRTTKKTTQRTASTTVVTVQTSTSTSHNTHTTSVPTTTELPTTATTVQQPQTIQPTTTEFDVGTGTAGSEAQTLMPFSDTQFPSSQQFSVDTEKLTESPTTESVALEPMSSREGPVNFPTTTYIDAQEDDYNLPSPSGLEGEVEDTAAVTDSDLYDVDQYDVEEHNDIQELILEEQGENIGELEAEIQSNNEEEEQEFEEINDQYTGDGMNACPVYEEVKAPFWANNTRNQVLALLNLYPFEQYIHMERCKDEGEQMLCRPGCRCEQQYRLHRLLAFDPKNECRGIFSDWFRFPSFCVCKCYNVPEQVLTDMYRQAKGMDQSPVPKKAYKQRHNNPDQGNKGNLANHRISKEAKVFRNGQMNYPDPIIPAVFPYEGKAAIMSELNRQAAATLASNMAANTFTYSANIDNMDPTLESVMAENDQLIDDVINDKMAATEELLEMVELGGEHIDNSVDDEFDHMKKSSKDGRQLDDHFFYNNPILEFKLPDGTTGSVDTPRRKK
jgi:hypothetical protein